MSVASQPGTLTRVQSALRAPDFRKLLWIRLCGQGGDGIFQAALVASVVFSPDQQNTAKGLLAASAVTILPFTLLGPFVGVFIDRWPRRAILTIAPLLKVAFVPLVLFDPLQWPVKIFFYAGVLAVLSINRFQLAAASAVVPRLVPAEDLLIANSIATVGGTLALLVGVFVGGQIDNTVGTVSVILIAVVAWLVASLIAGRIGSDLAPMTVQEAPELLRHALKRVVVETRDGASTMLRTPHAIGPIASITVDQIGQGVMLTLALVVFREQLGQGVASFSNVIGAGGVGVLIGIGTAGFLEERLTKERIVALGFLVGGIVLIGAAAAIEGPVILFVAAVLGLTFAWKKVSVDTMVQESLPDGYRGRVFSVYDFFYNMARLVAALVAVALFPVLSPASTLIVIGAIFLAWTPVLPWLVSRRAQINLRMTDAGLPTSLQWGATNEPVTVLEATELGYRLALEDGSVIDVRPAVGAPGWRVLREREG
ncbi:MAG TPA: MFS transporter [Actinomycetota bacterium]|jgi:MFS family permease|nr:MFS transporter [Actinomycetota bacterium]